VNHGMVSRKRERKKIVCALTIRNKTNGVGDLAQWYSVCLSSTRPWVQSSALEKKEKRKKKKEKRKKKKEKRKKKKEKRKKKKEKRKKKKEKRKKKHD
jgi:mannitol-specific phosphotransferase system IIBC component